MPKNSLNVSLKGADDIFSTEESRQEQQREQVQQIPIGELFPFKNHPFKVLDDESMQRTVESVEQYGVLSPLIARPRPEGGYEIISGHRRQYAAKLAGVDKIYKIGGAQAIAALAYGTQTIDRVDKIVGPGNIYVAAAKKLVYGTVDIDMIAGPSEILVVADEKANAEYVAADLLSQAEHDPMASAILLTTNEELLDLVNQELLKQSAVLPKKEIVEQSLKNYGKAIVCDSIEECISISNEIAPEHLELMIQNPMEHLQEVKNAGSVFLGYYTCESIGDYFGGTNHVLPTSGTARFSSALSVDSFIKKSSYLYYSKQAIEAYGKYIETIASEEHLQAHANAAKVRMK